MSGLVTKRLLLEPLSRVHVTEDYLSWLNDPDVHRFLDSKGGYTLAQLEDYVDALNRRKALAWAIQIKSSKKHIGNIKVDPINAIHRNAEYGILIGDKKSWGQGYAREASERVFDLLFSRHYKINKITLGVVADNQAAIRCYEGMGFVLEGVYIKHALHDGQWRDVLRMALFNKDQNSWDV